MHATTQPRVACQMGTFVLRKMDLLHTYEYYTRIPVQCGTTKIVTFSFVPKTGVHAAMRGHVAGGVVLTMNAWYYVIIPNS